MARVIKKFTIMSHPSHTVTIIKINVSLARPRVIKKFTIISHPSHTGLFSYTSTYLQLVAVRKSASFPASLRLQHRSAVAQGLKSSLMTRKYTYFRKNRVQIRKVLVKCRQNVANKLFISRYFNPVEPCVYLQQPDSADG